MHSSRWALMSYIAVTVFVCCVGGQASAQTAFNRNDSYNWITHDLKINTSSHNLSAAVVVPVAYPQFTIRVSVGYVLESFVVYRIKLDMNGDGIDDHVFDNAGEFATYTWLYNYPSPSVASVSYNIRVTCETRAPDGNITPHVLFAPITIVPTARAYVDANNNAFAQMRDADCTNKIPVLIVEGIDAENLTFPPHYNVQYQDFNADMWANGYELFVLNFAQGGIRMQDNVPVFLSALDKIHQLCPNYRIGVFGYSMGGIIARYALAQREQQGVPHNVGLFITYDSPLEGAWINPALEDQIAGTISNDPITVSLKARLNCAAAMQMQLRNPYNLSGSMFNTFHAEIDALNGGSGYPHQSLNVAVSNGNLFHSIARGWVDKGGFLASLTVTDNGVGTVIYNLPTQEGDLGAGGLSNNAPMSIRGDLFSIPSWLPLVGGHDVDYLFQQQINPVFVPTWSALGMKFTTPGPGGTQLVLQNGYGDITAHGPSPFDQTIMQDTPRMHAEMSYYCRSQVLPLFSKTVSLTLNYNLPDGGAIDSDTYQTQVLSNGVTVTIQPHNVMVNGQQVTYAFAYWDDGSTQNPRILFTSHDATRTAVMKAHLVAATSGTSWVSSQPRVAEGQDASDATAHSVYESGGKVWYLRNVHRAGWEAENVLSSPLSMTASSPTIWASGATVTAAWVEGAALKYRKSTDNGTTWNAAVTVPTYGTVVAPVLGTGQDVLWVQSGTYPGVYRYDFAQGPGVPPYEQPIPNTTNATSAAVVYMGANGPCYASSGNMTEAVVYVSGSVLYEVDLDGVWTGQEARTCAPAVPVSAVPAAGWTASSPCVARNYGDLYVAWLESSGTARRIAVRRRSYGSWLAPAYFSTSAALKPVLAVDNACGNVNLLWEDAGHIRRATCALAGGNWSTVVDLGTGRAVSAAQYDALHLTAMWMGTVGTPYPISLTSTLACAATVGGGGCPFVDTQTDTGWVVENSVLSRSLGGPPPLDVYRLTGVPVVTDGHVALRVRENEDEVSEIDRMRLVAVDHPIGTDVARVDGEYVVGTWHSPYQIMGPTGDDLTAQLGTPYGHFQGEPGDTLLVWMHDPNGSEVAEVGNAMVIGPGGKGGASTLAARGDNGPLSSAAIDAGLLRFTGIEVQQQDSSGVWETVRHIYPREFFAQTAIDTLLSDPIRLVFVGHHALRGLGWLEPSGDSAVVQELPLLTAVHSSLGDVQAALLGSDAGMFLEDHASTVELVNGDTLNVEFGATAPDDAVAREYVLLAEGTYTTATGEVVPLHRSLAPPEGALRFALAQNRPNPFGMGTAIGFDLPRSSHVRLEIFDLQGRRVQTIADKDYAPGHWNATWNRRDLNGAIVPGGVYLYRLSAGAFRSQRKMVLLP